MTDKQQRLSSYVSGAGLLVYETEQYSKKCNSWYLVGDSSTNKELVQAMIENHNLRQQYNNIQG